MNITLDTTTLNHGTGTSRSWSHTINSLANYFIVLSSIHSGGGGRTISGITCGGNAMAQLKTDGSTTTEIWAIANPPTGSQTITVTYGSAPTYSTVRGVSLFNVDTLNPVYDDHAEYATSTPSTTMNTLVGGMVIDSLYQLSSTSPTQGTDQVKIQEYQVPSGRRTVGSYKPVDATTEAMSWSVNSEHGWCIVSLKPKDDTGGSFLLNFI
jgi:hypothetical protein